MSAQVSAVTSETRGPLVTMTSISRWSRRPVQVLRSGLASSASTSAWLRWAMTFWLAFLGRMASTRAIDQACSGWLQRRVAEQRVDRRQPQVAGLGGCCAASAPAPRGNR